MTLAAATVATAGRVRDVLADLPMIRAMSIGGSSAAGLDDEHSDLDIHVYWTAPLPEPALRAARLERCADSGTVRVDVRSWGLEDWLWIGGRKIELVYLFLPDIEQQIEQAYAAGLDSASVTTALLSIVAAGKACYDPDGVWAAMHARLNAEFPEPTRAAVLGHRTPLLRVLIKELRRAQVRGDLLFVESTRGELQALYFNLLFTLNRRYHPGGKRLLAHAERCPIRPPGLAARWDAMIRLAPDDPTLAVHADTLTSELLELLARSGVETRAEPW